MGTIYRTITIGKYEFETKGIFDIVIVILLVFLGYKVGQLDALRMAEYYHQVCSEVAQKALNLY